MKVVKLLKTSETGGNASFWFVFKRTAGECTISSDKAFHVLITRNVKRIWRMLVWQRGRINFLSCTASVV